MSLTSTAHLVAAVVCVAAACVMFVRARSRAVRLAHLVVLACMVALAGLMGSLVVALASFVALSMTAVALVVRSRERAAHACAIDLAACSGLVLLMAAPLLLRATGHAAAPAAGEAGLHAGVHAAIPGGADHQVALTVLAVLLVVGWALARHSPAASSRPAAGAAWLMMAAMGAMVAA